LPPSLYLNEVMPGPPQSSNSLWAHFIIVVDVAGSRCSDGDDALFPSYFAEAVNISAQLRSAIVVIVVLLLVLGEDTIEGQEGGGGGGAVGIHTLCQWGDERGEITNKNRPASSSLCV